MSATKFKIGDKVRRKTAHVWQHGYTQSYTVTGVYHENITIKEINDYSWNEEYFYLVESARPVNPPFIEEIPAVTRLKLGQYGNVCIHNSGDARKRYVWVKNMESIKTIREAISTLSGIADFLEEQEKEKS